METRYLQTLVMVVETGSFSRAAEKLNITQSAASQRIKFLEERYGHQLLDRSGPVLVPTEAGGLVLEKARIILDQERELLRELKNFGGGKRLSFCCTPTFGMACLPGILNDFILQHADVADLKFIFHQPEQALRGLQNNEFDLAIIEHCRECDLELFRKFELPRDELLFISSPVLGIAPALVELEDLLKNRLYARKDGCSSKMLLCRNLGALGREIGDFQSVVVSDDLRLTIQTVLSGGGVSFVSKSLVGDYLKNGQLRSHQVKGFDHFRFRTVFLNQNRDSDPVLRNFLECVFCRMGTGFPGTTGGQAAMVE